MSAWEVPNTPRRVGIYNNFTKNGATQADVTSAKSDVSQAENNVKEAEQAKNESSNNSQNNTADMQQDQEKKDLSSEISAQQGVVSQVESDLNNINSSISDISGQLNSLTQPNASDYKDEEGKVSDAYYAALAQYQSEKANLESQLTAAQSTQTSLQAQLETEQAKLNELEQEQSQQEMQDSTQNPMGEEEKDPMEDIQCNWNVNEANQELNAAEQNLAAVEASYEETQKEEKEEESPFDKINNTQFSDESLKNAKIKSESRDETLKFEALQEVRDNAKTELKTTDLTAKYIKNEDFEDIKATEEDNKYYYKAADGTEISIDKDKAETLTIKQNSKTGEIVVIGANHANIKMNGKSNVTVLESTVDKIQINDSNEKDAVAKLNIQGSKTTVAEINGGNSQGVTNINISEGAKISDKINTSDGKNIITVSKGSEVANLNTGNGEDTVYVKDSTVNNINTKDGNDEIIIEDSQIQNEFKTNNAKNVSITGTKIKGDINIGNCEKANVSISGSEVDGKIYAAAKENIINIYDSTVNSIQTNGEENTNKIIIGNSTIKNEILASSTSAGYDLTVTNSAINKVKGLVNDDVTKVTSANSYISGVENLDSEHLNINYAEELNNLGIDMTDAKKLSATGEQRQVYEIIDKDGNVRYEDEETHKKNTSSRSSRNPNQEAASLIKQDCYVADNGTVVWAKSGVGEIYAKPDGEIIVNGTQATEIMSNSEAKTTIVNSMINKQENIKGNVEYINSKVNNSTVADDAKNVSITSNKADIKNINAKSANVDINAEKDSNIGKVNANGDNNKIKVHNNSSKVGDINAGGGTAVEIEGNVDQGNEKASSFGNIKTDTGRINITSQNTSYGNVETNGGVLDINAQNGSIGNIKNDRDNAEQTRQGDKKSTRINLEGMNAGNIETNAAADIRLSGTNAGDIINNKHGGNNLKIDNNSKVNDISYKINNENKGKNNIEITNGSSANEINAYGPYNSLTADGAKIEWVNIGGATTTAIYASDIGQLHNISGDIAIQSSNIGGFVPYGRDTNIYLENNSLNFSIEDSNFNDSYTGTIYINGVAYQSYECDESNTNAAETIVNKMHEKNTNEIFQMLGNKMPDEILNIVTESDTELTEEEIIKKLFNSDSEKTQEFKKQIIQQITDSLEAEQERIDNYNANKGPLHIFSNDDIAMEHAQNKLNYNKELLENVKDKDIMKILSLYTSIEKEKTDAEKVSGVMTSLEYVDKLTDKDINDLLNTLEYTANQLEWMTTEDDGAIKEQIAKLNNILGIGTTRNEVMANITSFRETLKELKEKNKNGTLTSQEFVSQYKVLTGHDLSEENLNSLMDNIRNNDAFDSEIYEEIQKYKDSQNKIFEVGEFIVVMAAGSVVSMVTAGAAGPAVAAALSSMGNMGIALTSTTVSFLTKLTIEATERQSNKTSADDLTQEEIGKMAAYMYAGCVAGQFGNFLGRNVDKLFENIDMNELSSILTKALSKSAELAGDTTLTVALDYVIAGEGDFTEELRQNIISELQGYLTSKFTNTIVENNPQWKQKVADYYASKGTQEDCMKLGYTKQEAKDLANMSQADRDIKIMFDIKEGKLDPSKINAGEASNTKSAAETETSAKTKTQQENNSAEQKTKDTSAETKTEETQTKDSNTEANSKNKPKEEYVFGGRKTYEYKGDQVIEKTVNNIDNTETTIIKDANGNQISKVVETKDAYSRTTSSTTQYDANDNIITRQEIFKNGTTEKVVTYDGNNNKIGEQETIREGGKTTVREYDANGRQISVNITDFEESEALQDINATETLKEEFAGIKVDEKYDIQEYAAKRAESIKESTQEEINSLLKEAGFADREIRAMEQQLKYTPEQYSVALELKGLGLDSNTASSIPRMSNEKILSDVNKLAKIGVSSEVISRLWTDDAIGNISEETFRNIDTLMDAGVSAKAIDSVVKNMNEANLDMFTDSATSKIANLIDSGANGDLVVNLSKTLGDQYETVLDKHGDFIKSLDNKAVNDLNMLIEGGTLTDIVNLNGKFDIYNQIINGEKLDAELHSRVSDIANKFGIKINLDNNAISSSYDGEFSGKTIISDNYLKTIESTLQHMKDNNIPIPENIYVSDLIKDGAVGGFCGSNDNTIIIKASMPDDNLPYASIAILHETSHMVDWQAGFGGKYASEFNAELNSFFKFEQNTKTGEQNITGFDLGFDEQISAGDIGKYISNYATTDVMEFVAEVGALVKNGSIKQDSTGNYYIDKNYTTSKYAQGWEGSPEDISKLNQIMTAYAVLTQDISNIARSKNLQDNKLLSAALTDSDSESKSLMQKAAETGNQSNKNEDQSGQSKQGEQSNPNNKNEQNSSIKQKEENTAIKNSSDADNSTVKSTSGDKKALSIPDENRKYKEGESISINCRDGKIDAKVVKVDEDGKLLEVKSIDGKTKTEYEYENGKIKKTTVTEKDEKGNIIRTTEEKNDKYGYRIENLTKTIKNEYNKDGELVKETTTEKDENGNPKSITREIIAHDKDNKQPIREKYTIKNADGSIEYQTKEYKYDNNNKGKIATETITTTDNAGNPIKQEQYKYKYTDDGKSATLTTTDAGDNTLYESTIAYQPWDDTQIKYEHRTIKTTSKNFEAAYNEAGNDVRSRQNLSVIFKVDDDAELAYSDVKMLEKIARTKTDTSNTSAFEGVKELANEISTETGISTKDIGAIFTSEDVNEQNFNWHEYLKEEKTQKRIDSIKTIDEMCKENGDAAKFIDFAGNSKESGWADSQTIKRSLVDLLSNAEDRGDATARLTEIMAKDNWEKYSKIIGQAIDIKNMVEDPETFANANKLYDACSEALNKEEQTTATLTFNRESTTIKINKSAARLLMTADSDPDKDSVQYQSLVKASHYENTFYNLKKFIEADDDAKKTSSIEADDAANAAKKTSPIDYLLKITNPDNRITGLLTLNSLYDANNLLELLSVCKDNESISTKFDVDTLIDAVENPYRFKAAQEIIKSDGFKNIGSFATAILAQNYNCSPEDYKNAIEHLGLDIDKIGAEKLSDPAFVKGIAALGQAMKIEADTNGKIDLSKCSISDKFDIINSLNDNYFNILNENVKIDTDCVQKYIERLGIDTPTQDAFYRYWAGIKNNIEDYKNKQYEIKDFKDPELLKRSLKTMRVENPDENALGQLQAAIKSGNTSDIKNNLVELLKTSDEFGDPRKLGQLLSTELSKYSNLGLDDNSIKEIISELTVNRDVSKLNELAELEDGILYSGDAQMYSIDIARTLTLNNPAFMSNTNSLSDKIEEYLENAGFKISDEGARVTLITSIKTYSEEISKYQRSLPQTKISDLINSKDTKKSKIEYNGSEIQIIDDRNSHEFNGFVYAVGALTGGQTTTILDILSKSTYTYGYNSDTAHSTSYIDAGSNNLNIYGPQGVVFEADTNSLLTFWPSDSSTHFRMMGIETYKYYTDIGTTDISFQNRINAQRKYLSEIGYKVEDNFKNYREAVSYDKSSLIDTKNKNMFSDSILNESLVINVSTTALYVQLDSNSEEIDFNTAISDDIKSTAAALNIPIVILGKKV